MPEDELYRSCKTRPRRPPYVQQGADVMATLDDQDVIIIGAGVSGIAAGYHLQKRCPNKRYCILEARRAVGGTWDLFRYPGIRSDSDMNTFGYAFRPWTGGKVFASGSDIKSYVEETAKAYGIDRHIHFGQKVVGADWDSNTARWTLTVADTADGSQQKVRCQHVVMAVGYYHYGSGYMPDFPGIERFGGDIIHPQQWEPHYDYAGKTVVVIGSGATAVTLVPAMAEKTRHITMLQRSPTYISALPSVDATAVFLRRFLPDRLVYRLTRARNILMTILFFALSQAFPDFVRASVRKKTIERLGDDYPVDTHFKPRYNPWDERFCLAPDGDFFDVIKSGKASVVTDHIDSFEDDGIRLTSGEKLQADLVVPATGLRVQLFGGIAITVDGQPFVASQSFSYRGMMFTGLPNTAVMIGYTNASWTLKVDLTAERICRMINYMDRHGLDACVPDAPDGLDPAPILNLASGYLKRAESVMPKQGDVHPWRTYHNYIQDMLSIRYGAINDGAIRFWSAADRPTA